MSDTNDTVCKNQIIEMHYVLKDDDGEVIDKSEDGHPLSYLHGHDNIVPGLEKALAGAKVGELREVIVSPEEGYGVREEEMILKVPRDQLPSEIQPEVGMGLDMETSEGHSLPVLITAVHDDHVMMDANHELAGVRLHFEVKIAGIRAATQEEISHGHAHGPHGHQH